MLLIHVRTVAFLTSLFTAIQCSLWIVGYILYILAFSCSYNTKYFSSIPLKFDLPTDLGSYYIWYLQGSNCTTSLNWIDGVRRQSPNLLVSLLSIGFSLNVILLTTSIYMIVGFYKDIGKPGLRLKIFSYSVLLVSVWDIILVAVFSMDFSPLLDENNYIKGMYSVNSTNPSIMALPYFTEVFTVLILLLSRLILFWVCNVFFAAYLLAKDYIEISPGSSPSVPNTNTIQNNIKRNSSRVENMESPVELSNVKPGKDYFANTRFRQQIPSPAMEHAEVTQRWIISSAKEQNLFYPVLKDEEEYHDIGLSSVPENQSLPIVENVEDTRKTVEWDDHWNRKEPTVVANVKRAEPNKRVTLNHKPSIVHMGQSFSQNHPSDLVIPSKTPEQRRESFKKQGFRYFPSVTGSVKSKNPFNVKLKPVRRDSIPREEAERNPHNTSENSGNSGGEASPYLISPLSSLDPDYVPRDHMNFPPSPPISSQVSQEITPKTDTGRPPLPPPDAPRPPPGWSNLGFTPQMSLEEAIKTRRPLKPVNRSPIDTTC